MEKIRLRELDAMISRAGIGLDNDSIDDTPFAAICHSHTWDHGCAHVNSFAVGMDGTPIAFRKVGPRRLFYRDMRDMCEYLFMYLKLSNCRKLVAAPCFRRNQFAEIDKNDEIFCEIYSFLKSCKIRLGERSGAVIRLPDDLDSVEMLIEGGFRGVSELCLFAPELNLLIVPSHHFEILLFSHSLDTDIIAEVSRHFIDVRCSFANYIRCCKKTKDRSDF